MDQNPYESPEQDEDEDGGGRSVLQAIYITQIACVWLFLLCFAGFCLIGYYLQPPEGALPPLMRGILFVGAASFCLAFVCGLISRVARY
jgi:hypothetical protein